VTRSAPILLIEDDPNLGESLRDHLQREGYAPTLATSLSGARKVLAADAPSLIILDWMLPDGQGIDFLRELRAAGNRSPTILLTARADLVDKIVGLETGANDYMTKPFEPRELVARIRAQLRTAASAGTEARSGEPDATIEVSGLRIVPRTREVTFRGKALELTRMEYELLRLLAENPDRVFTRDELLNKVWGYESFPTTRTVDNHVLQLRQKTEESLFETVRGVGYRLKGVPTEKMTKR
jgi:DNA-binding response OmpR family regulator